MTRLVHVLATLVVIASIARAESSAPDREPLPVERFRLGNGLDVMLAPDATASVVAVHLRYDTGVASERANEAGYTHLVEKLLGAGSVHVKDFEARIDAVGGWTTSTTTADYLGVTDQVPAHALPLVLWLEAERMAGLADALTAPAIAKARDEVQAEWRAAYVEQPYALVTRELSRALWTDRFAGYGRPALGDGNHVANATLEEVRAFARLRLVPNRATLVIAGKLDVASAKRLVERYFGWLPMRETVAPERALGKLGPARGAVLMVNDPIAKVVVAYRCPPFDLTIDIAAQLLAGGRSSRLQRRLSGLATDVHTEIVRQRVGELHIVATPAPGADTNAIAAAIRDEVGKLGAASAEDIERAAALVETDLLLALENPAVRAELLASWTAFAGTGSLLDLWPRRASVKPERVAETIGRWLGDQGAVTVIGRPEAK